MTCIAHKAFSKSLNLPREVSVSFRFHFEQHEPVCSFNITSLLTAEKTMKALETHLGEEVARLVADRTQWNGETSSRLAVNSCLGSFEEGLQSWLWSHKKSCTATLSTTGLRVQPSVKWKDLSSLPYLIG